MPARQQNFMTRIFMTCKIVMIPVGLFMLASCQSSPLKKQAPPANLSELAQSAPFIIKTERPHPAALPNGIAAAIKEKKESGRSDHLGLLVEYGLRIHWGYLQHTHLARELPVESDVVLSELIRITEIPQYETAHEAGWLNRQFMGPFNQTGWSSYQIYVWVKENLTTILSDRKRFPNWQRIGELMERIDNSNLNGIGGGEVCHYWCI